MHFPTSTPLLLLLSSLTQISAKNIVYPRATPENVGHALDIGLHHQFDDAFNMIKDNESQKFCQQLVDKLPKGSDGGGSEKAVANDNNGNPSPDSDSESDDEDGDEKDQGDKPDQGDHSVERSDDAPAEDTVVESPPAGEQAPEAAPDATPTPAPDAALDAAPDAAPDATPTPAPDAAPDATPTPAPDAASDAAPAPAPDSAPAPAPEATPDDGVPPGIPGAGPDAAAAEKDVVYSSNMNIDPTTGEPETMETGYHMASNDNVNVNQNINANGDIFPPTAAGMEKRDSAQDQQGDYDLYGLTVPKGLIGFDPKTLEGACKKYVLGHI